MVLCSGESANEVWVQATKALLNGGDSAERQSRAGATQELLHAVLSIDDPRNRWIVAREPAISPAFALAEVVWILNGRRDTAFLEHWFPDYPSYVGGSGNQYAAYGYRLRYHFGLDQLHRAYEALRSNPATRQVVLQMWSVTDDLPEPSGKPRSDDIPCNVLSCLKVCDGRLHWLQIVRSNDIDRGLPHNVVQFTFLQEVMAGWLGVQPGEYVHVADSLHWYVEKSKRLAVGSAEPQPNTDRFDQPYEDSTTAFAVLGTQLDAIRGARRAKADPNYDQSPAAWPIFDNIYFVLAAEDARQYGQRQIAERLMTSCTNPAYHQLWSRWVSRVGWRTVAADRVRSTGG